MISFENGKRTALRIVDNGVKKTKPCLHQFRMWAMGYKPRPLLVAINPKAHKKKLICKCKTFCSIELHKSQFGLQSQTRPRSPNIALVRFVILAGITLDKKFQCLCEYI